MVKLYSVFALCSFLCSLNVSLGQIVQDGQCDDNISLVENFHFGMFIGTWYEIQRTKSAEQNTDCAAFEITVSSNTINVQHYGVNDNFEEDSEGTASLSSGVARLVLNITMFDGPMDFWVLMTDYDNFAVTYSCENISPNQRRIYLWVLGRERTYGNHLIEGHIAITLNTLLGVSLDRLKFIDHSDTACYVLPNIEAGENVILPGQCDPNTQVEQNFRLADYVGSWYIIEAYPVPFEFGTCNKIEYALKDDGSLHIENIQVVNHLLDIKNGSAVITSNDNKESAKLDVQLNIDGVDVTRQYWVLATDYDSYALVYSCQNIDAEIRSVFSWKLSRTSSLTAAANAAINTVINYVQVLNRRYFTKKSHTDEDCFYYPENIGGDVLLPGQCLEDSAVPAVTDFNGSLFAGTWHEVSRFPSDMQDGECAATDYAISGSNVFTITHTSVKNEREISKTRHAAIARDGRGVISVNEAPFKNIFILATDYTEYALAYSCRNLGDQKQIYSWKLSRSRTGLSASANSMINQLVYDNIDLWEGYYKPTDQDNDACFHYPVFNEVPPFIELPGPCPDNIRGVQDFDVNAYLGKWYEIARYPTPKQIGQCSRVEFNQLDEILVANTEGVAELTLLTQRGIAEASTDGTGKLTIEFIDDGGHRTITYYILATDYDSYSLVYSCTNIDNGKSRVSSWKLSRTKSFNSEAIAAMALSIADTKGLIEEYYQTTNQTDDDCFYVPPVNINKPPVFRGQCESISGIEDFDVQKYLGWWHEIERYPIEGSGGDCRSSKYIQEGETYQVVDTQVQNNEGTVVTGTVTISNDGRLRRSMPDKPDQDVWVLATDYETFALLYSCENVSDEYKIVWSAKHSKARALTEEAQTAMTSVITNNKVLYDQFYLNVDQTDSACFFYPSPPVDGHVVIPGQCDTTIPVVQNFRALNFAGTWYQLERYDEVGESSCVGSKYTIDKDSDNFNVLNYETQHGQLQTQEGSARVVSTDGSARIGITVPVSGLEDSSHTTNVLILATDYTSYALAYSCVNVNPFQRQVRAWKLSRSRILFTAGTAVIDNIMRQRVELHQQYFKRIKQSDECLEPSSALMIKNSFIVILVCISLLYIS